jgi:hypothetical protein
MGRLTANGLDALMLIGVVLCIPFIILLIGLPIALVVRLVLELGRLL